LKRFLGEGFFIPFLLYFIEMFFGERFKLNDTSD